VGLRRDQTVSGEANCCTRRDHVGVPEHVLADDHRSVCMPPAREADVGREALAQSLGRAREGEARAHGSFGIVSCAFGHPK